MKKLILFLLTIILFTGCDPVSLMDADITNATSEPLSIVFVPTTGSEEALQLEANETVLFQEGMSTTGGFLEPSLVEFDSVYIVNESNEILKVFKQDTEGKNIYAVEDDWLFTKPSKRFYQYDYQINNEDLE